MNKQFNKTLIMSENEEYLFQQSNSCWICKKLIDNDEEEVRNHCHVNGKFRGAAHWSCNIDLQLTKNVPVIFHNLRGYESHLIFCELDKFDLKISVIPNGLEKYTAFFFNKNLVFIDSIQFMSSSLDKLVKSLSDEDFKYLVEELGSENLELLKQKDAYTYKYMNSFERFNEKKLLTRKDFFSSIKKGKIGDNSKISGGHISVKDCLTCEKICDKFEMKNMGDYHDYFLKKDVLLSADVFEKFIDPCLKFYGLDPCHYFSSAGLSWDAMLKVTGVKLEKISDIDKHLFIEKGLRGEISYIAKRYAKANNKYMNYYDPKKPSTFISYLDTNNLYGWAMTGYPYEGFEWLKNICEIDVMSVSEKSPIGYFLEVDLKHPDELRGLHNGYPLAPEKLAVSSDM